MHSNRFPFLFLLLLTAAVPAALAQLDNASVLGTVFDPSGAVVVDAAVTVRNLATGMTVSLRSDTNGVFFAPVLPVGSYRLTVSAQGFKTYARPDIVLRVADRARLDITLETGQLTEILTVTGEAPIVETGSTTLGGTVTNQQVSELPSNGRSVSSLLALAPGVNMLGGANSSMGGGSFARLFEAGAKLLVDGGDSGQIDSDLPSAGYASSARVSRASLDAIEEVRMQQSSFSAEYGQSTAAVVNFITKSGTNRFHGVLFQYFRNEKLDSRNYFNVAPQLKPPFRLNQFGGTLGGPIVHDKLFFFVNFEGVRQRLGLVQNTFVPAQAFRNTLPAPIREAANLLPLPNAEVSPSEPRLGRFAKGYSNELTENTGSFKVDYQMSPKDRLSVRYNHNYAFTKTWFGIGDAQYRPVDSTLELAKVTYTKTLSSSMLNELGFALNRLHTDPRAAGDDFTLNYPTITVAGMATIGPSVNDLLVTNESRTLLDTFSWVKGRQQLKFGFQIVHQHARKAAPYQRALAFNTVDEFAANNPFSATTRGNPRLGLNNSLNHFFVQDDIQVSRRLTINAGLRYQFDTAPNDDYNRIAAFDPVTRDLAPVTRDFFHAPRWNFGPRFGVAYTPMVSHKTVIRAGYGIFHNGINPAMAQISAIPQISQAATIVRPGVGLPFPTVTPAAVGLSMFTVPYDYKAPYTETWNFNIQQGLGKNMMLQVGYVGNRGLHVSPYQQINNIDPVTGLRPYAPKFSSINNFFNGGHSNYNSLQATLRKRFSRGVTFNVNYTWAHALDNGLNSSVQNDADFRSDYGNADHDVRHVLEFDYTYKIPALPGAPKFLGSGWQFNGLTMMRSGMPYTVLCGCDNVGIGRTSTRPDLIPGVPVSPASFDMPNNQLNLAAFRRPAAGKFGNLGRNTLFGPAALNWDYSLFKNFRVTERQSVQFRAEMFNLFNKPQFSNPSATLLTPSTFGRSLTTINSVAGFGSNRQIQFALRYTF